MKQELESLGSGPSAVADELCDFVNLSEHHFSHL